MEETNYHEKVDPYSEVPLQRFRLFGMSMILLSYLFYFSRLFITSHRTEETSVVIIYVCKLFTR